MSPKDALQMVSEIEQLAAKLSGIFETLNAQPVKIGVGSREVYFNYNPLLSQLLLSPLSEFRNSLQKAEAKDKQDESAKLLSLIKQAVREVMAENKGGLNGNM